MVKNDFYNLLLFIVILIVGIVFVSIIFGGGGMMMGGMMGFGGLFMLLPVIFIIILIYAILDRDRPSYDQSRTYPGESPIQILERRYANGEISRDDYLRIKSDLNKRY